MAIQIDNYNVRIISRGSQADKCTIIFRHQFGRVDAVIVGGAHSHIGVFCNFICINNLYGSHRIHGFRLLLGLRLRFRRMLGFLI